MHAANLRVCYLEIYVFLNFWAVFIQGEGEAKALQFLSISNYLQKADKNSEFMWHTCAIPLIAISSKETWFGNSFERLIDLPVKAFPVKLGNTSDS